MELFMQLIGHAVEVSFKNTPEAGNKYPDFMYKTIINVNGVDMSVRVFLEIFNMPFYGRHNGRYIMAIPYNITPIIESRFCSGLAVMHQLYIDDQDVYFMGGVFPLIGRVVANSDHFSFILDLMVNKTVILSPRRTWDLTINGDELDRNNIDSLPELTVSIGNRVSI